MRDFEDFYMEMPAIMAHVDTRKPLCNKGKASKPKPPPPAMAPYEEVTGSADTSFNKMAQRRQGLRSTILSMPQLQQPVEGNAAALGTMGTALGSMGTPPAQVPASQPPARPTQLQTALKQRL